MSLALTFFTLFTRLNGKLDVRSWPNNPAEF